MRKRLQNRLVRVLLPAVAAIGSIGTNWPWFVWAASMISGAAFAFWGYLEGLTTYGYMPLALAALATFTCVYLTLTANRIWSPPRLKIVQPSLKEEFEKTRTQPVVAEKRSDQVWTMRLVGDEFGFASLPGQGQPPFETIKLELINHSKERINDVEVGVRGEGHSRTRLGDLYLPVFNDVPPELYLKNSRDTPYVNGHGQSATYTLLSRSLITDALWWGAPGITPLKSSSSGLELVQWSLTITVCSTAKAHYFNLEVMTYGNKVIFASGGENGELKCHVAST